MGNEDHVHVALPKLYGAPAYARPPVTPVRPVERPFDPDELPLTSELSQEERALVDQLGARPYDGAASSVAASSVAAASVGVPAPAGEPSMLNGRPFRLRGIGKLFRGSEHDNKGSEHDNKGGDRDTGPAQPQADASDAESDRRISNG